MKGSEQLRTLVMNNSKLYFDTKEQIDVKKKVIFANKKKFKDFEARTKVKLAEAERL